MNDGGTGVAGQCDVAAGASQREWSTAPLAPVAHARKRRLAALRGDAEHGPRLPGVARLAALTTFYLKI